MKTMSRTKEWIIFSLTGSLTGAIVIGLCFIALSIVGGGETDPLASALMVVMAGVFSVFFAIIPSAITAVIVANQSKTTQRQYIIHSIAIGVTVTALCALAYCVVDGVSLLGSWSAIGSSEFWNQYAPHLGIAILTGFCAPFVGALMVAKVRPQSFGATKR